MKRLLLLPLGLLLLASCKEKNGPIIDFSPKATETEFMAATPEAPEPRMVLIEEFTGVKCPNCPLGHQLLKTMEEAHPNRIATIGIQIIGNPQADPVDDPATGIKTRHDNRTEAGTALANGIYASNIALPSAGFDRAPYSGLLFNDRTAWPSMLPARIDVPTKANVKVTSSYNAATKQATIKVHVAYTGTVTANQLLTVALVENDIVDAQYQPNLQPTIQDYTQQHVLRDILTSPTGTAILGDKPTKAAGQVYERTFVYNVVSTVLNPDNCRVIAFVSNNDGADKEVVQADEAPLK